jgi:hypothetical protein
MLVEEILELVVVPHIHAEVEAELAELAEQ